MGKPKRKGTANIRARLHDAETAITRARRALHPRYDDLDDIDPVGALEAIASARSGLFLADQAIRALAEGEKP